jgi:hypothetical protein
MGCPIKVVIRKASNGEVVWRGEDLLAADVWYDKWLQGQQESEETMVTFHVTTPANEEYASFEENLNYLLAGCLDEKTFLCHLARWLECRTATASDESSFISKRKSIEKAYMALEEAAGVENWAMHAFPVV